MARVISSVLVSLVAVFFFMIVGVTVHAETQEDVLLEFKKNVTFTNDSPLYSGWPCVDDQCPPECSCTRPCGPDDTDSQCQCQPNDPSLLCQCNPRVDHDCLCKPRLYGGPPCQCNPRVDHDCKCNPRQQCRPKNRHPRCGICDGPNVNAYLCDCRRSRNSTVTVSCDPDDNNPTKCTCEPQHDVSAGCVMSRPPRDVCNLFDGHEFGSWRGVWCHSGNVTKLNLGLAGLSGSAESIEILLRLPKLDVLMLYNNSFTGHVSDNVKKVRYVNLVNNTGLIGPCTQEPCIKNEPT